MRTLGIIAAGLLVANVAQAGPARSEAEQTVDDATLQLTLLEEAISGDVRSFCQVRIHVLSADVELTVNDRVLLWLYEDDLAGDDNLWHHEFRVTAEEVAAGEVDRVLNCASDFGDDVGDVREIYADSRVEKDACSGFCRHDRPTTPNIAVAEVDDDMAEDADDDREGAVPTPLGPTTDRIGRDADWFAVTLVDRSLVTFSVNHAPDLGRLDAVLFGPDGMQIQVGEDREEATVVDTLPLEPGDYAVRVQPRDGQNFNFYDADLRVLTGGCEPGAIEVSPCERCGSRRRECDNDGQWGDFSNCLGQGECDPGADRRVVCGNCGEELQSCTDACQWMPGQCVGGGECAAGDEDTQGCDEGVGIRTRICSQMCTWGEFEACRGGECEAGERQECYNGSPGTAGVGRCQLGEQRCEERLWGPCEGEVVPTEEICDDGIDNDCDGAQDGTDTDCDETVEVGDPCDGDDCGDELECQRPPSAPGFIGGYCGLADCDMDCPDESLCGQVFGRRYCLKACERESDCRPDYLCADVDANRMACIPRCRGDVDCRDRMFPDCDERSGLCLPENAEPIRMDMRMQPPPPRDMGVQPNPQPGTMDAQVGGRIDGGEFADTSDDEGCNCDLRGGSPAGAWLLLLLVFGLRRRAR